MNRHARHVVDSGAGRTAREATVPLGPNGSPTLATSSCLIICNKLDKLDQVRTSVRSGSSIKEACEFRVFIKDGCWTRF